MPGESSAVPQPASRVERATRALDEKTRELLEACKGEAVHKLAADQNRKDRSSEAAERMFDLAQAHRAAEARVMACKDHLVAAHTEMILALTEEANSVDIPRVE